MRTHTHTHTPCSIQVFEHIFQLVFLVYLLTCYCLIMTTFYFNCKLLLLSLCFNNHMPECFLNLNMYQKLPTSLFKWTLGVHPRTSDLVGLRCDSASSFQASSQVMMLLLLEPYFGNHWSEYWGSLWEGILPSPLKYNKDIMNSTTNYWILHYCVQHLLVTQFQFVYFIINNCLVL